MALRLFLALNGLLWFLYGAFCFFAPERFSEIAGVGPTSTTGTIEIRAMYGGLEMGLGALTGAALILEHLRRPALLALAFLCSGLFPSRLAAAVTMSDFSDYTIGALILEFLLATTAVRMLSAQPSRPA
jgi:hypothetical protein